MKKFLIPLLILIIALGLSAIVIGKSLVGGGEDTWICSNGQWVKHGNPSKPMPQTGCGGEKQTNSPTPYPDTQHAIQAILATKYNRPVSEVNVTVTKEVQGFASGSVLFGQGGPGEGGMWLAVLGNGWDVVWDGNGNVDCTKMRQEYGFPDSILKPNFCE